MPKFSIEGIPHRFVIFVATMLSIPRDKQIVDFWKTLQLERAQNSTRQSIMTHTCVTDAFAKRMKSLTKKRWKSRVPFMANVRASISSINCFLYEEAQSFHAQYKKNWGYSTPLSNSSCRVEFLHFLAVPEDQHTCCFNVVEGISNPCFQKGHFLEVFPEKLP